MKKLIAVLAAIGVTGFVALEGVNVALVHEQVLAAEATQRLLILKTEADLRGLVLKMQIAKLLSAMPAPEKSAQNPEAQPPTPLRPSAKDGTPLQTL